MGMFGWEMSGCVRCLGVGYLGGYVWLVDVLVGDVGVVDDWVGMPCW